MYGLLHVIDFKGGAGVYVDCDYNSQMMLYALGVLNGYGSIYDIEMVRMTIVQPWLDNISTFECPKGTGGLGRKYQGSCKDGL